MEIKSDHSAELRTNAPASYARGMRLFRGAALASLLAGCGSDLLAPLDGATQDGALPADAGARDGPGGAALWSLGYYASWDPGQYPVSEIDWSGLTHIAIAFYLPQSDGSLQLLGNDPQVIADIVAGAHAHGVQVIASLGGADSGAAFEQATSSGTRSSFVGNIVSLVASVGFDGVDIDWEPLTHADEPAAIDLGGRIRAGHPGLLMTAAIGYVNPNLSVDLSGYPAIATAFDQLNIMSYGMAGAWPGWKSWHSSPIYRQDSATPLSIDSTVAAYVAAGVPKAKLGVGIGFFGLCYSPPVSGPDQPLGGSMIVASDGTMSYAHIMTHYFSSSARTFDPLARVPYLSFSSVQGPDGCTYISYDDEQSIAEKGAYVKAMGLGGVMVWEINEGYLASAAAGQRNPLLDAIRDNVLR